MSEPWYNYRVGAAVHASRELGLYRRLETLFQQRPHWRRRAVLAVLHPDWRRDGNGSLLSKSRFCFWPSFPSISARA